MSESKRQARKNGGSSRSLRRPPPPPRKAGFPWGWIVSGMVLVVVIGIVYVIIQGQPKANASTNGAPDLGPARASSSAPTVDGISCDSSERVAFHIHAHLAIYNNGSPVGVPYGIGIGQPWSTQQSATGPFVTGGSCFYWLHAHTGDGVIHIESPVNNSYTLGNFFDVWGQQLEDGQVGSLQGSITAYLNGEVTQSNPRDIPLTPHAVIQLDIGSASPPPQSYTFDPGL